MSKLLIYIGEGQKFDIPAVIQRISSMNGVSNARVGSFVGAVFECEYTFNGRNTIVRISPDAETITVEGLGDESLDFAVKLQALWAEPLSAIDMDYSFNIELSGLSSVTEVRHAMSEKKT